MRCRNCLEKPESISEAYSMARAKHATAQSETIRACITTAATAVTAVTAATDGV